MTAFIPASLLINTLLLALITLAGSKSSMTQVLFIVFLYWLYRRFYVHNIRVKLDTESDLAAIKITSLTEHIKLLKELENVPTSASKRKKFAKRNISQRIEFLRQLKKKRASGREITAPLRGLSCGSCVISVLLLTTLLWGKPELWKDIKDAWYERQVAGYYEKQEYDKAISLSGKRFKGDNAAAAYHYNLGLAHLRKQDYQEALVEFQKTLKINPGYIDAYYNIAQIYQKQGKIEEEIKQYEKILSLDSTVADAHYSLGLAYLKKNDIPKARNSVRKAYELYEADNPWKKKAARLLTVIEQS